MPFQRMFILIRPIGDNARKMAKNGDSKNSNL